jgi:hypothetical protein
MITLLLHLFRVLPFLFGGCRQLAVENLALRQQLSVYKRTTTRPKLRTTDRLFWVGLARVWAGWRQSLVIVTPDTVSRSKTRVRRPDVEFRPAVHPSPLDAGVVDRNVDASQVVPAALQVHGRAAAAARAAATIDRVKEISVIFTHVDGLTETYGPETVC